MIVVKETIVGVYSLNFEDQFSSAFKVYKELELFYILNIFWLAEKFNCFQVIFINTRLSKFSNIFVSISFFFLNTFFCL